MFAALRSLHHDDGRFKEFVHLFGNPGATRRICNLVFAPLDLLELMLGGKYFYYPHSVGHKRRKLFEDLRITCFSRKAEIHNLAFAAASDRERGREHKVRTRIEAFGIPHRQTRAHKLSDHKLCEIEMSDIDHRTFLCKSDAHRPAGLYFLCGCVERRNIRCVFRNKRLGDIFLFRFGMSGTIAAVLRLDKRVYAASRTALTAVFRRHALLRPVTLAEEKLL